MNRLETLRGDIQAELEAYSSAVDELELVVAEAEVAVSEHKFHDVEKTQLLERTKERTDGSSR